MRRDRDVSDIVQVRKCLRGGDAAMGMSDHNNRPVNDCGCVRDCFSVRIHVSRGGWVIAAACQRHGAYVDTRKFVYERTEVVWPVPGTWDEEQ